VQTRQTRCAVFRKAKRSTPRPRGQWKRCGPEQEGDVVGSAEGGRGGVSRKSVVGSAKILAISRDRNEVRKLLKTKLETR